MTSYDGSAPRAASSRRDKVRGYLRAANELRQSYQATVERKLQASEMDGLMPGDFPDVAIARSGNEEMLLFPSYARKHVKQKPNPNNGPNIQPGTRELVDSVHSSGDAEYWKREWERYEDANAIVDVDVRGWIYSPQSGPLSRKNRLLVAVARRLSGIYAPAPSPSQSRASSTNPINRERLEDSTTRHEEEIAAREAEHIARHGQREAAAALRGSYSQESPPASRSSSPSRASILTQDSEDEAPGQRSIIKRQSWNEPANMSRDQIAAANDLLMTRLKPFMSMPTANTPITVFFFNDSKSVSKSVTTNESGHFNLRAALDFVPDKVRVLASDKLSAVEDVLVTESQGISLVSDIDDTIKHSAISSGAREIFKNTFIRELGDLTIKGVKEWYTTLANMGVKMHYVSNSPWQLYPLLRSYFSLAGLPPGSFHLKQYSGMLQGIFEPAAERKRGSLDRIMNDFPERKFILVGDSGEADLEVYTDVVLDHPGRVLGVFIRDVTTPPKKGFFDQAVSNTPPDSMISNNGARLTQTPLNEDKPEDRPVLPNRPRSDPEISTKEEEDLIDFGDDPAPRQSEQNSASADDMRLLNGKNAAPNKPNKPSSLRTFSTSSSPITNHDTISEINSKSQETSKKKAPPPPKPRRSSKDVHAQGRPPFSSARQNQSPHHPELQKQQTSSSTTSSIRPSTIRTNTSTSTMSTRSTNNDQGYVASARRQITSVYNALPALRSTEVVEPGSEAQSKPSVPPRRGLTSYPAAAARWATGATGGDPAAGGDGGAPGATYDKKLEIWKRRWQRSEEIMQKRGIILRTWRVGSDVMEECVKLVQREMDRAEDETKQRKRVKEWQW